MKLAMKTLQQFLMKKKNYRELKEKIRMMKVKEVILKKMI